ncbi:hypothetical protein RUND412_002523 [Rhizina undulata]
MPLTIIRSPPSPSTYTPLTIHQSQTPASFSTPVLHFRSENSRLLVANSQVSYLPIFGDDAGSDEDQEKEKVFEGIDVWVTSENVIIFNTSSSSGVHLPYTSITLHAIQRVSDASTGIYMQISLSPSFAATSNPEAYDDEDLLELTVVPLPESDELTNDFFKALSDCSNLHPDADSSDADENEDPILLEGGLEGARLEGFPEGLGEGGWITAENVDQFRFEDAPEGGAEGMVVLGPGAGTVRARDEDEPDVGQGINGGEGVEEAKWRRTD